MHDASFVDIIILQTQSLYKNGQIFMNILQFSICFCTQCKGRQSKHLCESHDNNLITRMRTLRVFVSCFSVSAGKCQFNILPPGVSIKTAFTEISLLRRNRNQLCFKTQIMSHTIMERLVYHHQIGKIYEYGIQGAIINEVGQNIYLYSVHAIELIYQNNFFVDPIVMG